VRVYDDAVLLPPSMLHRAVCDSARLSLSICVGVQVICREQSLSLSLSLALSECE